MIIIIYPEIFKVDGMFWSHFFSRSVCPSNEFFHVRSAVVWLTLIDSGLQYVLYNGGGRRENFIFCASLDL